MRKRNQGLTLIEVLIAAGMAAVLMALVGQLLSIANRQERRTGARTEGSAAIGLISEAVMGAIPFRIPDAFNLPGVGVKAGLKVTPQAITIRRATADGYERLTLETFCQPAGGGGFSGISNRFGLGPLGPTAFNELYAKGFQAACGQAGYAGCSSDQVPALRMTTFRNSETNVVQTMLMPSPNGSHSEALSAGICTASLSSYELLISFQYVLPSGGALTIRRREEIYPMGQEDLNSPNRNDNILFLK